VFFCIRDDDTSFFTVPEDLERAYGSVMQHGPISLAIVPFCRAGTSRGVPNAFRGKWSVHPLETNRPLVDYLRERIRAGGFEAMLHGYHHDEPNGHPEFAGTDDLCRRLTHGRDYLEALLDTRVRVFVPPHNAIRRAGLRAVAAAGLHLGGVGGMRAGWPLLSRQSWSSALWLRRWRRMNGVGIPRVLDLGDHREIAGVPITPSSSPARNEAIFDAALARNGVFCAATHYWELDVPSTHAGPRTVGDHLRRLIDRAVADRRIVWRSVGDVVSDPTSA
jgi:hypothetical protein